jgi:Fe2+ transport system protein FeoA
MGIVFQLCNRYFICKRTAQFIACCVSEIKKNMKTEQEEKLSEVSPGVQYTIQHLNAKPETCQRLREIGFHEQTAVRTVVKNSSQIICEVQNTRIGLHNRIAKDIFVVPSEQMEP